MALGSHLKSVVKAVTWRALGAVDTFALCWLVTGHPGAAAGVVGFEVLTKSLLYYGHERVWEMPWLAGLFVPAKGASHA